jgi:hypothetical protein
MYCMKKLASQMISTIAWVTGRAPNPSGGTSPDRVKAAIVPELTISTEKVHRNGVVLDAEAFADNLGISGSV